MAQNEIWRLPYNKAQILAFIEHIIPAIDEETKEWLTWDIANMVEVQTGIRAEAISIVSIEKTGTSGNDDTYTITLSDGTTTTFTVHNGRDGTGSVVSVAGLRPDATGNVALSPSDIGAQTKVVYRTITLPVSGWAASGDGYAQTVTVSGVLADETKQLIQPVPALASQTAYMEAGVRATGQAANSLAFYADSKPSSALTIYVCITEVTAA